MKDSEKIRLLKESEIGIVIDNYDDIFSDFDPRPYSQRALSQDFLEEAKIASKDKNFDQLEIKFLVPRNARNEREEAVIKKRLKEHFSKHALILRKEHRKIIEEGTFLSVIGAVLMVLATFLFVKEDSRMFMKILSVLFEPGGLFLFWEGLDLIIFRSRTETPDFRFYKKMATADISFRNY